jgi:hypothetical protein
MEQITKETKISKYTDSQKKAIYKYLEAHKDELRGKKAVYNKEYYQLKKQSDEFVKLKREKAKQYYQRKKEMQQAKEQDKANLLKTLSIDGFTPEQSYRLVNEAFDNKCLLLYFGDKEFRDNNDICKFLASETRKLTVEEATIVWGDGGTLCDQNNYNMVHMILNEKYREPTLLLVLGAETN